MSIPDLLGATDCHCLRVEKPGEVCRLKGNGSIRRAGPKQGGSGGGWPTPRADLPVLADPVCDGMLESCKICWVQVDSAVARSRPEQGMFVDGWAYDNI